MIRFKILLILLIGAVYNVYADCPAPSLLSVSNISDTSAILTWTDVGDAYEIELRLLSEALTGTPTHVVPSDPPFTLTGLIPGQQYRFRVRTVCSGGGESAWSVVRNFATDLNNAWPCPLDFTLRDTSCASGGQFFDLWVNDVPGNALGNDYIIKGVRLMATHPWRSDLRVWLTSPDGTRVQLVGNLNAGDQNLGDPAGNGGCGQYMELSDNPAAPLLTSAAEMDNITGLWRSVEMIGNFNNGQNPNGKWLLEFCDNKLNHTGKLRLAQLVFEPTGCASPDGLAASNIAINSADISWDAGSVTGDSIEIVYGPSGFLPENGTGTSLQIATSATLPYILTNLTGLQQYDVFIRQQCGPGVWSGYENPVSFFTVCPATLIESFDTLGICPTACADACPLPGLWQNAAGDDYEWKVRTGPGITYPVAGPPSAYGGSGNYLFFRNSCTPTGANNKKAILRTLCVDMNAPQGTSCHFSIDIYMNTKLGQMGSLLLEISTNGGINWQPIHTWSGNQGKEWKRTFVNLSAYDGQIVLLQLTATGVTGAYGDIAIDNLTFYGATQAGSPDYTFYRDNDGDGVGETAQKLISCSPTPPVGYVTGSGDCNDLNAGIYPGATEIKCNGIDENCNGLTDDQFIAAPVIVPVNGVCKGGSITLTTQNPTPNGQFYWFNANEGGQVIGTGNALTINNITEELYVWVADSFATGGCSSNRTGYIVSVLPTPELVLGNEPEICAGNAVDLSDLLLNDIAQTAGTMSFYQNFPFNGANQINNTLVQPSQSTNYFAQKITVAGCADTLQIPLTVFPNPVVNIANGDIVQQCKGRSVTLTATGTPGVSFNWSNGLFFNTITVIANGSGGNMTTYSVTATDSNGCLASDAVVVETLSGINQTNVAGIQHVTSCGGNDGSISLQPLDGLAPYTFSWTGPNMSSGSVSGIGVNGGVINGLSQGGYRITVTDANGSGCSMVLPSIVINAPGLTVSSPVITHPVCPGGTGSITVSATGTAPVYNWSNSATTASISGVPADIYSVTITDGSCQQILGGLEITAPPVLDIIQNQIVQIDCNGAQNGAIDIAVFGGTPGYTFAWSDMNSQEDRSNLLPGNYSVTVTDNKLCTSVAGPFAISEPPALQLTSTVQPVKCFGGTDGVATLNVNGGTGYYLIEWSNGQFGTAIGEVAAGTFTVTVTDQAACTALLNVVVSQPQELQVVGEMVQNPVCTGNANGSVNPVVTGGTMPFAYQWSNGQTTSTAVNLDSGFYNFTLTDANGCTLNSYDFEVSAPQLLSFTTNSIENVNCFNGSNGAFDLTVNGTVGGYTSWVNGIPDALVQTSLMSGIYQIFVEDGRGCAISTVVNILQPENSLLVTIDAVQHVACAGDPTGAITINTAGGTAPYQFLWSNNTDNEDLDAVPAGNYTLTVVDANNCSVVAPLVNIQEPSPIIVLPEITSIPCFGSPYGRILLDVSGGIQPYEYQWSNGATTQDIFDLGAGNYKVSIFDAAGCLIVYDRLEIFNKNAEFHIEPGGYQPVSCTAGNDGLLQINVINGRPPFQYAWSAPVGLHANSPLPYDIASGLSGGSYSVTVTDADGCYQSAGPFLVEEAPSITVQILDLQNIICKDEHTGLLSADASGGVPPLEFLWSNGDSGMLADSLPAGFYVLTVTDFRGCTTTVGPVQLTEPNIALTINTAQLQQDFCSNGTGFIDIFMTGGFPNYQYFWDTQDTTPDLTGLFAGNYAVTVTDEKGCTTTAAFELTQQAPALALASYSVQDVACFGGQSGSIGTGITGGNLPLYYFWSNGATTANIGNLTAGFYAVTVVDQKGCESIFYLPEVEQPDQPLSATVSSGLLPDGYTAALIVSGGTPGYNAQWDNAAGNQTGLVAVGLAKGMYQVTITDAGGCTLVMTVSVGLSVIDDLQSGKNQLVISPNPFLEKVCLQMREGAAQPVFIRVFSPEGRLVGESLERCIDLEDNPAGLYRIEAIWADGKVQVLKGLKMN